MILIEWIDFIFDLLDFSFLMGQPPASFNLFSFFSITNLNRKTVGLSGIRTEIVGEEDEQADTTIALLSFVYS